MLSNTFINDDDFNDYNYIQGQPLTENELTNINFLINYDFKNANDNELYKIITSAHIIFLMFMMILNLIKSIISL